MFDKNKKAEAGRKAKDKLSIEVEHQDIDVKAFPSAASSKPINLFRKKPPNKVDAEPKKEVKSHRQPRLDDIVISAKDKATAVNLFRKKIVKAEMAEDDDGGDVPAAISMQRKGGRNVQASTHRMVAKQVAAGSVFSPKDQPKGPVRQNLFKPQPTGGQAASGDERGPTEAASLNIFKAEEKGKAQSRNIFRTQQ